MSRTRIVLRGLTVPLAAVLFHAAGLAGPPCRAQEESPPKKAVYDEKADARKDLEAALAKARKDHQRVLVVFGANW